MTASDGDIARQVLAGDSDAFAQLVDRYQHRVFALALMLVRDRAAAEDVTQDAFVRAYVHLAQYESHRPFYPWMAAIAVRIAQNRWRTSARASRQTSVELAATIEGFSPAGTVLDDLVDAERRRGAWRAVAELPAGERACVFLHYRQELPLKEVARVLGVTTGTVKTLLFRARRHLREQLTTGKGPQRP